MKITKVDIKKIEDNDKYSLKWPFRMITIADSSRGKANLILYVIVSTKFFNKPYIIY